MKPHQSSRGPVPRAHNPFVGCRIVNGLSNGAEVFGRAAIAGLGVTEMG